MTGDQLIQELNQRRLKLIEDIRVAFDGVILGDGIGPYEALAIDDYIDEESEEYQTAKKKDQELGDRYGPNMSLISGSYMTMLFFGDIEGQIFALPATMTTRLTQEKWEQLGSDHVVEDIFMSLNPSQQEVVTRYLALLSDADGYTKTMVNQIKYLAYNIKDLGKGPLTSYQKILLLIGGVGIILYLLFGIK